MYLISHVKRETTIVIHVRKTVGNKLDFSLQKDGTETSSEQF